jgi:hypothetical protein
LKLPFISREEYERAIADLEYERARGDRLFVLLEVAIRIKKPKTKQEAPKPEPVVTVPIIPPAIQFAVEQRGGGDPSLRRHLYAYAQAQIAEKKPHDEIIKSIREGDEDDE